MTGAFAPEEDDGRSQRCRGPPAVRWRRGPGRNRIEDRRGRGFGGGAMRLPSPGGRAGAGGGIGLIVLVVAVLLLNGVLGGEGGGLAIDQPNLPGMSGAEGEPLSGTGPDAELADFVAFVVDDVQRSWEQLFRAAGRTYEPTVLVLFEGGTQSACGPASSATGPFYCPADRKVYLDLGFFEELRSRFGASGDFAQAYVIAHEFGHHVQTLLGINTDVRRAQDADPDRANDLSVRMELQADCFAGVWAFSAFEEGQLETGDLEEGLGAAAAIGDDRIQRQSGARVNPETWTHGSSDQRVRWFREGYQTGDPDACDTYSGDV